MSREETGTTNVQAVLIVLKKICKSYWTRMHRVVTGCLMNIDDKSASVASLQWQMLDRRLAGFVQNKFSIQKLCCVTRPVTLHAAAKHILMLMTNK